MPAGDLEQRINFQVTLNDKASKKMDTLAKSAKRLSKQSLAADRWLKEQFVSWDVDAMVKEKRQADAAVQDATKKSWKSFLTRFQPGFLSLMFGGMQLQRVMGGLIRGMISNFKELAAETDPTRIALTRLEGSLKFLKFQIVSAAGPLLQKFVDWLSNLANYIARSDPEKLKRLAIAIGALWTLGLALFVGGQLGTFVTGLGNLVMAVNDADKASTAAKITKLSNALNIAAGLGMVTLGLKTIIDTGEEVNNSLANQLLGTLAGAAKILGGALWLGKRPKGAIAAFAIGIVLETVSAEDGIQKIMKMLGDFIWAVVTPLAAALEWIVHGVWVGEDFSTVFKRTSDDVMESVNAMVEFGKKMDEIKAGSRDAGKTSLSDPAQMSILPPLITPVGQPTLLSIVAAKDKTVELDDSIMSLYSSNENLMTQAPLIINASDNKITKIIEEKEAVDDLTQSYIDLIEAQRNARRNDTNINQSSETNMTLVR